MVNRFDALNETFLKILDIPIDLPDEFQNPPLVMAELDKMKFR